MAWKGSGVRFPSAPLPYRPIQRIAHDQLAGRTALGRVPPGAEADRSRARGAPPRREQAERPPREPLGVRVEPEPAVDGRWVTPSSGGDHATHPLPLRRRVRPRVARVRGARLPGTWRTPPRRRLVLLANYRLAPESKFRAPLQRGRRLRVPAHARGSLPERTIVAGDSSGGGLAPRYSSRCGGATFRCRRAQWRCRRGPTPRAEGTSMSSCADVDITVTRDGLLDMAAQYLAEHDPKDPLASPVYGDFRRALAAAPARRR